jgi:hypothetical protein
LTGLTLYQGRGIGAMLVLLILLVEVDRADL